MTPDVRPGQVVLSTAGRDKGRYFIVCEIIDDRYVNVCDGRLRKADKPKKKNIKHLRVLPVVIDKIAGKLACRTVTDSEIRKALEAFI